MCMCIMSRANAFNSPICICGGVNVLFASVPCACAYVCVCAAFVCGCVQRVQVCAAFVCRCAGVCSVCVWKKFKETSISIHISPKIIHPQFCIVVSTRAGSRELTKYQEWPNTCMPVLADV